MLSTTPTSRRLWPAAEFDRRAVCRLLDRLVDGCLVLLLLIAPLFMAGRHPVGRMVFVVLALGACVLYCIRQSIRGSQPRRWHAAAWLWPLALGGVVLQICPLPSVVVQWLSGHKTHLLGGAGDGWTTISVAPAETSVALAVLFGYAALYWLLLQRIRSLDDVCRAAKLVAVAAMGMAVVGLLQRYTSDGRFLWVYDHPFRSASDFVKGTFANRNHFASFLAMGVGPLLAWLLVEIRQQPDRTAQPKSAPVHPLLIAGLVVTLLACVLSFSRGGTAALIASLAFLLAWLAWNRLLGWRTSATIVALGAVLVLLATWQGGNQLGGRLDDLVSGSADQLDRTGLRRSIWQANVDATAAGGVFGSGAGTHRALHAAYLPASSPKPFSHAENGYLQVASESGWWGVALLVAALLSVGTIVRRALQLARDDSEKLWVGACAAGLVVSLVHSLVDFVWFIPACMAVALVLLACLVRFVQLQSPPTEQPSSRPAARSVWLQSAAAATIALVVAIGPLWAPMRASASWDEYRRLAARRDRIELRVSRGEATGDEQATNDYRRWLADQMRSQLHRVMLLDPGDATAHVRYAEACLREFEARRATSSNRQNLIQIATTCRDVDFATEGATLEWMRRAFGSVDVDLLLAARRHAHHAIQLTPVDSAAWLIVARLQFLDPQSETTTDSLLATAQQLAPHSGEVLFEVGRHRMIVGEQQRAIEAWQRCYRAAGPYRLRVVEILAGKVPAAAFVEAFEPDWTTLHAVWSRYHEAGDAAQLRVLLDYAVAHTESAAQAELAVPPVHAWRRLGQMYIDLGDDQQALDKLNRAMECDANQFGVRFDLAQTLMRLEQFADAEQHYRWCLARRPEVSALRERLQQATQSRMKQIRTSAHGTNPGVPLR